MRPAVIGGACLFRHENDEKARIAVFYLMEKNSQLSNKHSYARLFSAENWLASQRLPTQNGLCYVCVVSVRNFAVKENQLNYCKKIYSNATKK